MNKHSPLSPFQGMRDACRLAREVLNHAAESVQPGVTTDVIDRAVHDRCTVRGAYPSPLLYKGFPKSVCTSVNNVACHGIPDDRPLQDGDIINIDVTVRGRSLFTESSGWGVLQNGRGASHIEPLQKGGWGQVSSILKGSQKVLR